MGTDTTKPESRAWIQGESIFMKEFCLGHSGPECRTVEEGKIIRWSEPFPFIEHSFILNIEFYYDNNCFPFLMLLLNNESYFVLKVILLNNSVYWNMQES
jgi:hypothetical protein